MSTPRIDTVMSKEIIAVRVTDTLVESYDLMRSYSIRHLPVVDKAGKVVGIISDRDFKRALIGDCESELFPYGSIVSDYMQSPVRQVDFNTSLSQVIEIMIDEKISCVLVTEEGRVAGIISHEDLLRLLDEKILAPQSGILEKFNNWFSKTPIGDISQRIAGIGI